MDLILRQDSYEAPQCKGHVFPPYLLSYVHPIPLCPAPGLALWLPGKKLIIVLWKNVAPLINLLASKEISIHMYHFPENFCKVFAHCGKLSKRNAYTSSLLRKEVASQIVLTDCFSLFHNWKTCWKIICFSSLCFLDNDDILSQYNTEVELHYSYIKDNLDNNIPSSLRVLRAVVDSLHKKIQKLENAIATQVDYCRSPCVVSCNIPVVSGKGTHSTLTTSLLPFISLCKLTDASFDCF